MLKWSEKIKTVDILLATTRWWFSLFGEKSWNWRRERYLCSTMIIQTSDYHIRLLRETQKSFPMQLIIFTFLVRMIFGFVFFLEIGSVSHGGSTLNMLFGCRFWAGEKSLGLHWFRVSFIHAGSGQLKIGLTKIALESLPRKSSSNAFAQTVDFYPWAVFFSSKTGNIEFGSVCMC